MLDSLALLNDIIDKIEKQEATMPKIETDLQKTVSDLLSEVVKSESTYNVKSFDDQMLKMVVSKPNPKNYEILSVSKNGLKFVLTEM